MTPVRRNRGLLARPEAAALAFLAPRIPRWVTPDMLSALSLLGAVVAASGFAMAIDNRLWLVLAVVGLTMNWLGDSLDGKLARERGPDRGKAGFMLDNGLDMISYLILAGGFSLSGLVAPAIPFLLLALYLMLANLALARLAVSGIFDLAVGRIGTTELRVGFVSLALALGFVQDTHVMTPIVMDFLILDVASLVWLASMTIGFTMTLRADVRTNLATANADTQSTSSITRPSSPPP
ncbi:CDP-alcohol phosphatidyltransferase family protein [Roseococcus pinisoli]|uniref:CDP-alcohol phosphatidyltransferase family protein n=1 Tax=Roseococcus pinisoli TaxID=2835040 RepID=A0ABS5QI91_9PROT|nr:CDP-alcohol phosphatidyltransferase family protein [Roseococcus pinisoli]MBS7813387.1 CDP-alcohol phosphatidyltransferase family protein [Roseococcus pinisoli]